jgi:hypothetical protein
VHMETRNGHVPVYSSDTVSDQMKEDKVGTLCSMHKEIRSAYSILIRKSEGKRPLGKPRHR